jgi:PAS domain S-box-containing protein
MYGTLSGINLVTRGSYFRTVALSGAIVSPIFALVAWWFVSDITELWWDRIIVSALGFLLWATPKEYFGSKRYFLRANYFYYYVYAVHVISSAMLNDFAVFQFLLVIVILQCCVLSFQDENDAAVFMISSTAVVVICLFLLGSLTVAEKAMNAVIMVTFGLLNTFLARMKCKIISNIRVNRDLLRSMVNKTESAIFVTDTRGNIFDCNSKATELFGYSRAEFLDHDFKMLRREELTEVEIEEGFHALKQDHFWSQEKILVRKDGRHFHAYISIALLHKNEEEFLVYRVRDIATLKQHEEDLMQAKELAESAAQAKSHFLATMTHEIRTPLNGVIGMASILQTSSLNTEQRDYVDTILKSGQSLMVLINDILDFSKMESGKSKLEEQTCDMRECIHEVVDLLRPHAEGKGIRLLLHVDKSIPAQVTSDAGRIKQVLLNLVGNAIKFTHQGHVKIDCILQALTTTHVDLKVVIEDTGMGVPADKLHLLFQSFVQVDSSMRRKFGGTGLGLAISKQITELLGGTISVASEEGKGTTFTLDLRLKTSIAEETVKGHHLEEWTPGDACKHLRVLVVEDNQVNQKVLEYMLQQAGLKAMVAGDGREALTVLESTDMDLIFMDVQMPEMNGLDATVEIRKRYGNRHCIVAMTANNSDKDRQEAFDSGMDHFISKPFVIQQLFSCLKMYLDRNENRSSAA